MTPSLPTLLMTSAIIWPTLGSWLDTVATCAVSSAVLTGRLRRLRSSTMASTPLSRPRLMPMGLAPAATLRKPSLIMAWASTVAVVVPSPAMSLVLVATSLTSWAPMFSKGSSSSISLAMVTPSLVIVGAPNFLSSTTLRPLGPKVTLTALASLSTPVLSECRADSANSNCLATLISPYASLVVDCGPSTPAPLRPGARGARPSVLISDNSQDVAPADDQQILASDLDLGADILGVEHLGALADLKRGARAVVVKGARTDRQHRAALRLLRGRVGQDHTARRDLFPLRRPDYDAIGQRLDGNHGRGCQRAFLLQTCTLLSTLRARVLIPARMVANQPSECKRGRRRRCANTSCPGRGVDGEPRGVHGASHARVARLLDGALKLGQRAHEVDAIRLLTVQQHDLIAVPLILEQGLDLPARIELLHVAEHA